MYKTLGICLLTLATLTACSTTSSDSGDAAKPSVIGKTFKGKWDDIAPTTLKVLSASQVRYCFRRECTTQTYSGKPERKISFTWGANRFSFTRTSSGYRGLFRGQNGNRSTVDMS